MQTYTEEFRKAGAEVIAISSSSVDDHRALAERIGGGFLLLSDPDGKVIETYGLLHVDALPGFALPVARPAEFIIDAAGIVQARFLTDNWRIRERPEKLLAEIAKTR